MHVVRGGREQEYGGVADIAGLAPAAGRDARQDRCAAVRVVAQRLGVVGDDIARRDGVDVDALGRPLAGEQPGEPSTPCLEAV